MSCECCAAAVFAFFLCDPILLRALAHSTRQAQRAFQEGLNSAAPDGALMASPPHPVAKNARPGVGGLDLLDVGEVNLFGKEEEQQTLHPYRRDLKPEINILLVGITGLRC